MAYVANNSTDDNIDRFTPSSSYISLVEYDKANKTMSITFKNGNQHRYLYTYPTTYDSFKQSPNHGVYYANAIKGKLQSVAIKTSNIGHIKSTPLHKAIKPKGLDNGLHQHNDDQSKRQRSSRSNAHGLTPNIPRTASH